MLIKCTQRIVFAALLLAGSIHFARAGEPAPVPAAKVTPALFADLQCEIAGKQLLLTWNGPIPPHKAEDFDVQIFTHDGEKKAFTIKAVSKTDPRLELFIVVRGAAVNIDVNANSDK